MTNKRIIYSFDSLLKGIDEKDRYFIISRVNVDIFDNNGEKIANENYKTIPVEIYDEKTVEKFVIESCAKLGLSFNLGPLFKLHRSYNIHKVELERCDLKDQRIIQLYLSKDKSYIPKILFFDSHIFSNSEPLRVEGMIQILSFVRISGDRRYEFLKNQSEIIEWSMKYHFVFPCDTRMKVNALICFLHRFQKRTMQIFPKPIIKLIINKII